MAALRRAFGPGWTVRHPSPVALDEDSEPEPDVTVGFDRDAKASLYARAAITDYWIVNLVDRVVEIRRGPMTSDAAPFGWTYERLSISGLGEMVTPSASAPPCPGSAAPSDLQPRARPRS